MGVTCSGLGPPHAPHLRLPHDWQQQAVQELKAQRIQHTADGVVAAGWQQPSHQQQPDKAALIARTFQQSQALLKVLLPLLGSYFWANVRGCHCRPGLITLGIGIIGLSCRSSRGRLLNTGLWWS
jgi:hypothetical protein